MHGEIETFCILDIAPVKSKDPVKGLRPGINGPETPAVVPPHAKEGEFVAFFRLEYRSGVHQFQTGSLRGHYPPVRKPGTRPEGYLDHLPCMHRQFTTRITLIQ